MALNIKDAETERLVAELAELSGESKTAAVRTAVRGRLAQLSTGSEETAALRLRRMRRLLEDEIWPLVPPEELGRPIPKEEQEAILGFDREEA
ncbi:type II toxin-antitoxin system VapB family antitoxin [Saccharomonospora iraqiensis]|uniref:type II toxin-antitoxin system VapB family antitoxin n=1 Tax=Saccharomonospora iraqiensis TaxID=52698 RepID=UPI00041206AD|nr:type II toxin-antitoxin system VapB family antitoxin [Saccharomonospora iraqiensis]